MEKMGEPVRQLITSSIVATIKLPREARVLLLEDDEERIEWFKQQIPNLDIVCTAEECVAWLAKSPPYDFIFLDHDLGVLDYELYAKGLTRPLGNGFQVATHLASMGYIGDNIVIHTWNPAGAGNMKNVLKKATVIPFGKFNIECY